MSYLKDDAELSPSAIFQARTDELKSTSPDSNISMNITSTEDQGTYTNYVNPIWVKLLDVAGMNVCYTHCSGSELYTADGRTILDCLSGHCVHNLGHNHPFVVAELVAELQSHSPSILQTTLVKAAGALAQMLCENAGGKASKG